MRKAELIILETVPLVCRSAGFADDEVGGRSADTRAAMDEVMTGKAAPESLTEANNQVNQLFG